VEIENKMDILLRNVMGHEEKGLAIITMVIIKIIKITIPEIIVPNWFYYQMITT
jgi:hypothetical protein